VRCDAMTADWSRVPHDVLWRISTWITNGVPDVNRVVLDITSKPRAPPSGSDPASPGRESGLHDAQPDDETPHVGGGITVENRAVRGMPGASRPLCVRRGHGVLAAVSFPPFSGHLP